MTKLSSLIHDSRDVTREQGRSNPHVTFCHFLVTNNLSHFDYQIQIPGQRGYKMAGIWFVGKYMNVSLSTFTIFKYQYILVRFPMTQETHDDLQALCCQLNK